MFIAFKKVNTNLNQVYEKKVCHPKKRQTTVSTGCTNTTYTTVKEIRYVELCSVVLSELKTFEALLGSVIIVKAVIGCDVPDSLARVSLDVML